MKPSLSYTALVISFLAVFSAQATVRTVSNNGFLPAQFSHLQTAIDASSPGDTLQVMGSTNTYGTAAINKRLTIIGNGLNQPGGNNFRTSISTVYIYSETDGAADNTVLMGIDIGNIYAGYNPNTGTSPFGVNSLILTRCALQNAVCYAASEAASPGSDLFLIQCVISANIDQSNFKSILCENSIFINYGTKLTNGLVTGSYIYNNCLFLGYYRYSYNLFSNLTNALFQNSVIVNDAGGSTFSGCIFRNCLTYNNQNDNLSSSGIQMVNCLIGQDPLFTLAPDYNSVWSISLDQLYNQSYVNLGLQASSPCRNAGLSGTNIGTTGGPNAFDYNKQSFAPVPRVKDVTVLSGQSLPATGGSINVQIQAVKGK